MAETVIRVVGVSKLYRLGTVTSRTLVQDTQRWWARVRGVPDPGAKVGELNDRTRKSDSNYVWALRDVSFDVSRGEVLGIVGANGAGKSTILKIMSRVTAPSEGEVRIRGRVASLLEVGTGFHPELTGRENIFLNGAILGMTKREITSKFEEITEFSGCQRYIDTPVKRYSSGMYVRLAFAVAAHLEPEILIVDEVLAVGDAAFQQKCLGKMKEVSSAGRTVLFVSHNLPAVRRLCSRVILMESGRVTCDGDANEVVDTYLDRVGSGSGSGAVLPKGYLYHDPEATLEHGCAVTGIEMLDASGAPKTSLHTWDTVRFRIHYNAVEHYPRGAVELQVQTQDQVSLMLFSTRPDGNMPMAIEPGRYYVDCDIPRWPLSGGHYSLGAGLAIPGERFLWNRPALSALVVNEKDVFESGLPPLSRRYHVATAHEWSPPVGE